MPTPLFISNIPSLERLVALEYGQVDDGRPPSDFDHVAQGVWRHVDGESKEPLGFVVLSLGECDLDAEGAAVLWNSEVYDVPLFGLTEATIAEVISATRANLGKRPTLNRVFFERAVGKSGQEAVEEWRLCLAAGDSMAHFGLGCALCEVGEYREAFQHLRHYAHIAPVIAWNWRWYGYAAEKIGETEEARKAYRQAVAINEKYCQEETGAGELLERLAAIQAKLASGGIDRSLVRIFDAMIWFSHPAAGIADRSREISVSLARSMPTVESPPLGR